MLRRSPSWVKTSPGRRRPSASVAPQKADTQRASARTGRRVSSHPGCPANQGVDLGSLGRAHALRRIDLYPVRAQAPSSHNRYSRMPKARKRRWRTKLLLGCEQPSIFPVANRLTAGAASPSIASQTLSVAPSGTTPSSTKRRSAISSFLASATMPTLRPRMPLSLNRSCHQSESLLLG